METRLLVAYGLIVIMAFAAVALGVYIIRARRERRRLMHGRYGGRKKR